MYLDETWAVKDAEGHQGVENPYWAPSEGHIDDDKLVVAWVAVAMVVARANEEFQPLVMVVATE